MLLNSSDNEKLFAKSVPVSVKDIYTNKSRTSHLFLSMEWQDASAGMYSRKVLVISLTDNDDPFFLYNLHLSEEDFQLLKASQDLLINFASFPQHIIDYIETCLFEERNPQPKFLLVFTINEKLGNVASPSQLDIVETNQFKHLTHLSLKFVAATESAIRQYLSSCFKNLKEENRQLHNKLSFLDQDSKDKLTACQHSLCGKDQELELLKKELNIQLTMKDSKHALEIQEERNRLIIKQREEETRMERERKEKEHNFRKQIQQFEARVSCLDTLNKELQDKNYKHESTIRELRLTLLSLEEETRRLNETIQSLRQKCDNLHSELREKQSHIHHLNEKISDAEQESRSKSQTLTRLKEQMETEARQLKTLKVELDNVNLQLEMGEKTQRILEGEKLDLNKVILKLQDKVKLLKPKCELSAKYKETIEEKEKLLLDLKKQIAELDINLETKNAEVKSLNNSMDLLQKKVDTLEVDLKTSDNVNRYLSRQLTDHCIFPLYENSPNLEPSPSSVAQKQLAKINSSGLRKSAGPDNSPSTLINSAAQKSVRRETPSPVYRKNSSTPSRLHTPDAIDSAYCTFPSGFTNQATPDNLQYSHNTNLDQGNFEIDPVALSAAFGSGDQTLKHSTAKKSTKPLRSITPKPLKKR